MFNLLAKISNASVGIPALSGGDLLKNVLNIVYFAIGIVAVVIVVFAGYQYVTSNGDSAKAATAMKTILYAVIGLVVAISAFAITNFVVGRF
jgi:hypothetical protein